MFRHLLRSFGAKPNSSWYYVFGVSTAAVLVATSFMNCSQAGFKAASSLDEVPVSTSCGTRKKVTQTEMFKLAHEAHHKTAANERVQCPGFFAEIDEPTGDTTGQQKVSGDLASRQKQISEANNCNVD